MRGLENSTFRSAASVLLCYFSLVSSLHLINTIPELLWILWRRPKSVSISYQHRYPVTTNPANPRSDCQLTQPEPAWYVSCQIMSEFDRTCDGDVDAWRSWNSYFHEWQFDIVQPGLGWDSGSLLKWYTAHLRPHQVMGTSQRTKIDNNQCRFLLDLMPC